MDQLICPACYEPAGFWVAEDGPWTNHSVSADREVRWVDNYMEGSIDITCNGCGAEPDDHLRDEICKLIHG